MAPGRAGAAGLGVACGVRAGMLPSGTWPARASPSARAADGSPAMVPTGVREPPERARAVHRPPFDEFLRWAGRAPCVPVYRQLTGDALTPVSAFAQIARDGPAFLFESVI